MTGRLLLLPAVIGLTFPLAGCTTRTFVDAEIARSEATQKAVVDRLAGSRPDVTLPST